MISDAVIFLKPLRHRLVRGPFDFCTIIRCAALRCSQRLLGRREILIVAVYWLDGLDWRVLAAAGGREDPSGRFQSWAAWELCQPCAPGSRELRFWGHV